MSQKHMSGFVPIPYKSAGKILFPLSLIMTLTGGLDWFMSWDLIPLAVSFFGLGLLIISIYLLFVVPREDSG